MSQEHHIVVIPGLGDDLDKIAFWLKSWKDDPRINSLHVVSADWKDRYDDKFRKPARVKERLNQIKTPDSKLSVVAISASASLVLGIMLGDSRVINKMANVCGRLRVKATGLPTLDPNLHLDPIYRETVEGVDHFEPNITLDQRRKVMTLRGIYDEQVPVSTIPLDGATNIRMPMIGHNFSITTALTFYKTKIIDFLDS